MSWLGDPIHPERARHARWDIATEEDQTGGVIAHACGSISRVDTMPLGALISAARGASSRPPLTA